MTPRQAADYLEAKRTDDTQFYALVGAHHAAHVAAGYIAAADRTEMTALLRSVEQPLMPAHVEASIQNAITNGLNTIQEIQP